MARPPAKALEPKIRPWFRALLRMLFRAGLGPTDLVAMLRAQVLVPDRGENPDPCQAAVPEPQGRRLPLLPRDVPQRGISFDSRPPVPNCRLMCPLQERAMRGESVPCAAMVRHRGRPRGGLGEVLRARIRPCRFIHSAISEFLTAFLGLLADQRWPAGDAPARELLSVARWLTGRDAPGDDGEDDGDSTGFMKMAETVGAHGSQVRLRFLLGTGRLSESEVREMVDHLIFTLEDDFLPCKDDPQRDRPAVSIEEGPKVPAARFLCPLQVRGLRGDTTVPCSEALSLRPAESLLRRVREEYPQGALNRSRPPQAAYWRDDAERPGGPRDPVQEVGMRPCRDLGMVLGNGLAWLLRQSISRFDHDYSVFLAVSGGK